MTNINLLGSKAPKTIAKKERKPKYAVELTKPALANQKEIASKPAAPSKGWLSSLKSLFRKKERPPQIKVKVIPENTRISTAFSKNNGRKNGAVISNNRQAPKDNYLANNRRSAAPPPPPPAPKKPVPKKIVKPIISREPAAQEGTIKYTEAPPPPPSLLDVNLIPREILDKLRPRKKLIGLGLFTLGTIIFVVLVYIGMIIYQANLVKKTAEVNEQITQVNKQIAEYQTIKEEAQRLNKSINNINKLLHEHIYWSAFFDTLAQYTIPNVYYQSMAGDVNGAITLSAVAVSYADIARQLVVFQSATDFVDSVIVTSGLGTTASNNEAGTKGVSFSISLSVIPDVFYIVDN